MPDNDWLCLNCFTQNAADNRMCIVCQQRHNTNHDTKGISNILRSWLWLIRFLSIVIAVSFFYYFHTYEGQDLFQFAVEGITEVFSHLQPSFAMVSDRIVRIDFHWVPTYIEEIGRWLSSDLLPYLVFEAIMILLWAIGFLFKKELCIRIRRGSVAPDFFILLILEIITALVCTVSLDKEIGAWYTFLFFQWLSICALYAIIVLVILILWFSFRAMISRKRIKRSETIGLILSLLVHTMIVYWFH